ncbi:MAG: hypothetical protein WCP30_09300 [Mycobacteriaceae bacterium]
MAEDPAPQSTTTPAGPEPAVKPASAQSPAASVLPPVPGPVLDTGYTPAGVPTLEGVREKIETRFGTALGATELAEETPEGKTAAHQFEVLHKAAEDKLEEIRASMRKSD